MVNGTDSTQKYSHFYKYNCSNMMTEKTRSEIENELNENKVQFPWNYGQKRTFHCM